ncbi:hypothetical protein AC579_6499, partial [Pseudocercospora musae]
LYASWVSTMFHKCCYQKLRVPPLPTPPPAVEVCRYAGIPSGLPVLACYYLKRNCSYTWLRMQYTDSQEGFWPWL